MQDPGRCQSTYYWMLDHPETERADPHEEDVGRVWCDSGRVYEAGKIKAVLEHERIVMSRRRINRIMKAGGRGGLVFEGPVPAAFGQAERRSGPEHPRPRIQWLRPRARTSPPTRPT